MEENWARLPDGRKFGAAIKVQVDHNDGRSIWCSTAAGQPNAPIRRSRRLKGSMPPARFRKRSALACLPFYVDRDGNVWAGDQIARNCEGADLIKFSPNGRVFNVVIDKNDIVYVADSQSGPIDNPGFTQGIRIGSVKDGKVTAFYSDVLRGAGSARRCWLGC